ncbi:MAG: GAF domain-containing protein, partial [Gemmatimonadetes bacterium]|nr:GAF domain-containing protein [Gemmatimonadota bacterium]
MTPSNRSSSASFKERYAVLLDIGRILTGTLRPDDLYRTIYEQASRVLETTGFYISLYDDATDAATVVFYADRGKEERVELSYRGSDSIPIREGRPTLNRVGHADEAILLLGHERDEVTRLAISAPMLQKGRVLGVISAQSYRPDAYTSDDLELLAAVADLAAVALDNARYVEETERRRREAERLEEI